MRHQQLTLSAPTLPRPRRASLALAVALAFSLAAGAATAQPSPATPTPAPSTAATPSSTAAPASAAPQAPATSHKALAAQEYGDGAKLAKEGRWQEAYPFFLKAWNHLQHWQIALSLGRVEVEVGKLRAAQQHLSFALGTSDLPPSDRKEANRLLDLARAKLGVLRIVATAPASADVFLDGELIGTTPFSSTEPADPGDHQIELRFGTTRKTHPATVETGQTREVTIDLRLPELDTPPPFSASPPSRPAPAPPAPPATPWPAVISLGAVALVGAGVGAGMWVASDGKGAEAGQVLKDSTIRVHADCARDGNQATCDQIEGLLKEQDSLATGTVISWMMGGLAAAGAITVWAILHRSPAGTGARVTPVVTPQHAGIVFLGTW